NNQASLANNSAHGLEEITARTHRDIREGETQRPGGSAATDVRLSRILPEREDVRRNFPGQDRREVRRRPEYSGSEDRRRVRAEAWTSDDRLLRGPRIDRQESRKAPCLGRARA